MPTNTLNNILSDPIFGIARDQCLGTLNKTTSTVSGNLRINIANSATTLDLVTTLQNSSPKNSNEAQILFQITNELRMLLQISKHSDSYQNHLKILNGIIDKLQKDYPTTLQTDYTVRPQRTAGF